MLVVQFLIRSTSILYHQWSASFVIEALLVSLLAIMVEVHCMRQSPPTRGRSMRPNQVKVLCMRQSPPTRGSYLSPIVVEV